jgi:DNA-binding response OmpR family regulator
MPNPTNAPRPRRAALAFELHAAALAAQELLLAARAIEGRVSSLCAEAPASAVRETVQLVRASASQMAIMLMTLSRGASGSRCARLRLSSNPSKPFGNGLAAINPSHANTARIESQTDSSMVREHENLSADLAAVLALLEGVLRPAEQWELQISIDAGEYGTALQTLCSILRDRSQGIPAEAADLLAEVGRDLRLGEMVGSKSSAPAGFAVLIVSSSQLAAAVASSTHLALAAAGFVVQLSNAESAETTVPDVVVALGGWGGLPITETIAAIRATFPTVPALGVVTDGEPLAALLDAGFSDCVHWPIDAAELVSRVRARIRELDAVIPALVTMDATRLTVQCNRVRARLTRAEFRLLRQLIDAGGRWVSTKDLVPTPNGRARAGAMSVAARVHAIRKKLIHEAWRLRSHHTLGYLFETSERASDDGSASKNE